MEWYIYHTAVVTYLHGVCKWNGEDSHCDVGHRQVDKKSSQIPRRPEQTNEILSTQLYGNLQVVNVYYTSSHSLVFVLLCSSKLHYNLCFGTGSVPTLILECEITRTHSELICKDPQV